MYTVFNKMSFMWSVSFNYSVLYDIVSWVILLSNFYLCFSYGEINIHSKRKEQEI